MKYDIVTLGEALIDFFALESDRPLAEVETFKRIAGGAPGNVAIGAAKIGMKTAFISRVGDDAFGQHIIKKMVAYGVDSQGIQIDTLVKTGLVFISLPTPNTREFLFYRNPGADMLLSASEIPEALLKTCHVFHFGSISQITEPSRSATFSALHEARRNGAIISYDPNIRLSLWHDQSLVRTTILETIPLVDIVKVNDDEMDFLFPGCKPIQGMNQLLELGPKLVLCTRGEHGSFFATRYFQGSHPVFQVTTVDSTGCGDSFLSAFLSRICHKTIDSIQNDYKLVHGAVRFGAAAAALTASRKGVTEALPTLEEIMTYFEQMEQQ